MENKNEEQIWRMTFSFRHKIKITNYVVQ